MQNAVPTGDYMRRIKEDGLAVVKGIKLSREDRARGLVIERLMCGEAFPSAELKKEYAEFADELMDEARAQLQADQDGLVEMTPEGIRITERGRPFARTICAKFDAYLGKSAAQHSTGV